MALPLCMMGAPPMTPAVRGETTSLSEEFRNHVTEECPHCPPADPIQDLLEKTKLYDDGFSEDESPEDDDPPEETIPGRICAVCRVEWEQHLPPYGPWCKGNGCLETETTKIGRFNPKNLVPHSEACIGGGTMGRVFLATYKKYMGQNTKISTLVLKRIGDIDDHVFAGRKKSLEPGVAELESTLIKIKHHHLVKIFDIIDGNKIVMELLPFGTLLNFLKQDKTKSVMNLSHLHYIAFQVSSAMACLERYAVKHGRLSASNTLVNKVSKCGRWIHVKLTDFGIPFSSTKCLEARLPWMSVEELTSGQTSSASDCWSFGVVVHEIFSFGKPPYNDLNPVTLRVWVPQGYRMLKDPEIPIEIYELMKSCWEAASLNRPSFKQLEVLLWNKFKEIPPTLLCNDCLEGKGVNARHK